MPEVVAMALAAVALEWGCADVCFLVLLGFGCFLRTMEMLTLHAWQVILDGQRGSLPLFLGHFRSILFCILAHNMLGKISSRLFQFLWPGMPEVSVFRFVGLQSFF